MPFVEKPRIPLNALWVEPSCSRSRGLRSNLWGIAISIAQLFQCAGRLHFERRFAIPKKTNPAVKIVRLSSSAASTKSSRYRHARNRKRTRSAALVTSESLGRWLAPNAFVHPTVGDGPTDRAWPIPPADRRAAVRELPDGWTMLGGRPNNRIQRRRCRYGVTWQISPFSLLMGV